MRRRRLRSASVFQEQVVCSSLSACSSRIEIGKGKRRRRHFVLPTGWCAASLGASVTQISVTASASTSSSSRVGTAFAQDAVHALRPKQSDSERDVDGFGAGHQHFPWPVTDQIALRCGLCGEVTRIGGRQAR